MTDSTHMTVMLENVRQQMKVLQTRADLAITWDLELVGDGETDNTAILQKAIDDLSNQGGGIIRLKNGVYRFTSVHLREFVIISGESRRHTVLKPLLSDAKGFITTAYKGPVQRFGIENLRIEGLWSKNPYQNGLHLDATEQDIPAYTGGAWYGFVSNTDIIGFDGDQIFMRAIDGRGDLANQFLTFTNVIAIRNTNTHSRSLRTVGQLGQTTFINCELDAYPPKVGVTEPGTNVEIGRSFNASNRPEDDIAPSCVNFITCTFQNSEYGVKIDRAENVNFIGGWFENLMYGVQLSQSASSIHFEGNRFANAGIDGSGNGYAIQVNNASATVIANRFLNSDWAIWGINNAEVVTLGNTGHVKTKGLTQHIGIDADGAINTGIGRDFLISGNKDVELKTITSKILPGETFTIRCWASSKGNFIRITSLGNISLPRAITLRHGNVATFGMSDVGKTVTLISTNAGEVYSPSLDSESVVASKFYIGDVIRNSAPAVGNPLGWVCTRSGFARYTLAKATTVLNSNVITVNNVWGWAKDDVICGIGIPDNTKITAIDTVTKQFTLSNTCAASGSNISLYDAQFQPYGIL